jgi:hypothetical protein
VWLMSSANPPPETHRECSSCHLTFELTLANFAKHKTCRGGFNRQCKSCIRAGKRQSAKHLRAIRASAPAPLRMGQECPDCCGMSHRRPETGCARCGGAYAPESLPELQTRRHWSYAV